MAVVPFDPEGSARLPAAFSIGTDRAFERGYEFKYAWNSAIHAFVCEHQTTTKVPTEVMVIKPTPRDADGAVWFVAWEGTLSSETFVARQGVFRTQERFWEAGNHAWERNSSSSPTNNENNWGGSMNAETLVHANVPYINGDSLQS